MIPMLELAESQEPGVMYCLRIERLFDFIERANGDICDEHCEHACFEHAEQG